MDSLKIEKYMDRQPIVLKPEMSLATAVEKLLKEKKTGAPVVDDNGTVVGFLSEQDCLAVMLKSSYHCDLTAVVGDCMKTEVISVSPEDSILGLAETMLEAKPKIYPVTVNGKLVATINRTQALTAINIYMQQCYLNQA